MPIGALFAVVQRVLWWGLPPGCPARCAGRRSSARCHGLSGNGPCLEAQRKLGESREHLAIVDVQSLLRPVGQLVVLKD